MGSILVGTASWTDRTLIASGWYPPEADTPEKRLRFYARQFPLVEVDATYYALPAEQTATSWAERTPAGFTFNVKAFSLFTQHPTPLKALPADLREAAAAGAAGKERVYLKDVDPAVADQAWDRFLAALEPLRRAGKLGAILLQFPPWFPIGRTRKDYIVACAQRAAPRRVCIEFRNKTWMTPENQEETLGFLASHGLPYVCVDMPQGYPSSIPPVLAATSDLALVRMHGHSDKWDSKNIYERFGYRYSDAEISEWAPKIRDLAAGASTTHVLFNNCYRNYAQVNAQQLEERLGADLQDDLQGQPGRAAAADERGDLVPVHVIGDGFGEGPGDPEQGELAGPPVMHRLVLVDALVPAAGRVRLHLPSPVRLDGDAARFRAAGQPPHQAQTTKVLLHLGRRPVGGADPDQLHQTTP
jgi:uncharacterized protein YecE (DUF72 family)